MGTANPEAILRRFTRNNCKHPTYQALAELGKAVKTIFLCNYLVSEPFRIEINEVSINNQNLPPFNIQKFPVKIIKELYLICLIELIEDLQC